MAPDQGRPRQPAERRIGDDADRRLAGSSPWRPSLRPSSASSVRTSLPRPSIQHQFGPPGHCRVPGHRGHGPVDRRPSGSPESRPRGVDLPRALTIGFSQAAALLPGISRSGRPLPPDFPGPEPRVRSPLRLPAGHPHHPGGRPVRRPASVGSRAAERAARGHLVGLVVAAVSGWASIRFLLHWLRTRSLAVFSVERIILAAVVVILVAMGH